MDVDDQHVATGQVMARDEASGDEASTLVEVEVLPRGRAGKSLWQLQPVVHSLTSSMCLFQCPVVPSESNRCLQMWAAD